MGLKVHASLDNLHCVTPTDPSREDEPYLWAFLVQVDGTTVRQRSNNPFRLSANVRVISGSGRPGNLGVDSFKSGGNIHIPPQIGRFDGVLKPIVLVLVQGGTSVRLFMPGTVGIFCLAIDEESTPRDAMEGAFNDVKKDVRMRFDDFLNGLNLQSLATAAITSSNPVATAQNLFNQQLRQFLATLPGEVTRVAIQSAEISVLSSWNPIEHIMAGLDPDEPVGSRQFVFNESSIITNNLAAPLHTDLRQPSSGLGGAWYILDGHLQADLGFTVNDLISPLTSVASRSIEPPQTYTFQRDHIVTCVYAGSTVDITTVATVKTYSISVQYPFAAYRYAINGQPLNGGAGSVTFTTDVRHQKFDEDHPPFIVSKQETGTVTVQFRKVRQPSDPQIEVLKISNNPDDGNYDVTVTVEAVLNDGRMFTVGEAYCSFEGLTLNPPADFLKRVKDCMANFVGTRWAKSKRASLVDLWGPMQRTQEYERYARELDALVEIGAFRPESVVRAKAIIAKNLQVAPQTG